MKNRLTKCSQVIVGMAGVLLAVDGCKKSAREIKKEMTLNYSEMVMRLANHNPEPAMFSDSEFTLPYFPRGYDWAEQDRVVAQSRDLSNDAEHALRHLLEFLENDSYSLTIKHEMRAVNYTVGSICNAIVVESLTAAYREHIPSGEMAFRKLNYPRLIPSGGLKKWCVAQLNRGKGFFELQIEIGEWAIDVINCLSGVNEEERQASVRGIEAACDKIRLERKAIVVKSIMRRETRQIYSKEEAGSLRDKIDKNPRFKWGGRQSD